MFIFRKNHQWAANNNQQNQVKTGGQNWNMSSGPAPSLGSPMANTWNQAPANANAFNPFASAMQPTPMVFILYYPLLAQQISGSVKVNGFLLF